MRVLVYPHTLHGGEVHTLGINNSNTHLLSAGKDGTISVWNVSDFVKFNKVDYSEIKANLENHTFQQNYTYHTSPVKTVVWSPVDDDAFISGDANGTIYMNNVKKNEPAKVYPFRQNEQASAIVDLTWSVDGRLICWSTVDGKVHILDLTRRTYQELTSLVKAEKLVPQRSLAFDPTNKYLITVGDDTVIYIYQFQYIPHSKNYQFKILHHITRLINEPNIHVNYSRISWSPGGEFVSIPSSSKNKTTLITILSKLSGWSNSFSLVGHGTECEVVRFSPQVFEKLEPEDSDLGFSNVIATSGSDQTLALWNTSKRSPIFVLQDAVKGAIVDICWERNGRSLFLASMDGNITVVTFEEKELGIPLTDEKIKELTVPDPIDPKSFNTKIEQSSGSRRTNNTVDILEGKDAISADVHDNKPTEEQIPKSNEVNGKQDLVTENIIASFTPDVIPPPDLTNANTVDDILDSAMEGSSSKDNKNSSNGTLVNKLEVSKQKVTTKNGKKRIQPVLVSGNKDASNNNSIQNTIEVKIGSKTGSVPKHMMELDKPSFNVSDEFYKQVKRQKVNDDTTKKQKRELEPVKFIGSVVVNPNTTFSKTRLATPKVRLGFSISSAIENDESFVLDVKNGSGNDARPSRITYFRKDKQIWTDFIPKFIHLVSEGSSFWAVSTNDGTVLTYSHTSGKRLLPPIVLGSPLSFLESHGKFLMAVTNIGELYVWDIDAKKLHLNSPSGVNVLLENNTKYLDEGLSRSDKITLCSITSVGIPLITLSNGSGYLFNIDLGAWQTITESWWAFGSHYWNSLSGENGNRPQSANLFGNEEDGESIMSLLENKTNEEIIRGSRTGRGKFFNKISKNMMMKEGFENLENTISVSHLENRILCCEILGEKKDFHEFFISYVKRICELGLKAKVFEICSQLLGPEAAEEDEDEDEIIETTWDPKICGLDKHELLKEVILNCSQLRDSQRILTYFAQKIGLL
ncbi:Hira-domain-containing protein [Yamadazyma tenuis ATCC 10573]|uniref:Protein HIR n=1 Tax=Candida tenuis (strain ATCC 10573 / BCRC 21748 / CBS 615 / JCM 9827 / NBRC 10315 / NRRL Y-1498 / VKM Y-70) TaxID=590646 RepID=G3AZ15_CANTC|nr:Hira-domain-containing protein [Yamadazyma tenuis ATCC 10573]EGV65980.1 Hira-domain-containing protein [Yamadazyma tenuis ATCC 10573]